MAHVVGPEHLGPRRQLEEDAVGVLEVDRAHEHTGMHLLADGPLAVVVVHDLGALDARRDQPLAVLLDPVGATWKRDVVHRPDRGGEVAVVGPRRGRRDPRRGRWRVGEPEEGQRVAVADVEEEVLPHALGQLDRLDQRHAEHIV